MVKNCDLEAVGRGQHFQDLDQIIFSKSDASWPVPWWLHISPYKKKSVQFWVEKKGWMKLALSNGIL